MSAQHDYWKECISIAAEECDLALTPEQLDCLAWAAEGGHENYGMAFYSPPPSDRLHAVEDEWKSKLISLQAEFDAYRCGAETAIKKALRVDQGSLVSIGHDGEVMRYCGRSERIL